MLSVCRQGRRDGWMTDHYITGPLCFPLDAASVIKHIQVFVYVGQYLFISYTPHSNAEARSPLRWGFPFEQTWPLLTQINAELNNGCWIHHQIKSNQKHIYIAPYVASESEARIIFYT